MGRLRGNFQATVDAKGRLKLPTAFKRLIEEKFGREVYVTSLTGDNILIYPVETWERVEDRLSSLSQSHPSLARYRRNSSFFGQESTMDPQGRVLIPSVLREYHGNLSGEVYVMGQTDFLVVEPKQQISDKVRTDPFTDEDATILSELGF